MHVASNMSSNEILFVSVVVVSTSVVGYELPDICLMDGQS